MIATITLNPSLDEWAYLDRLRVGDLNRAAAAERYPGGKGINVSRVVHELGGRTIALAIAGGTDGTVLGQLLAQHGIRHQFITVRGSTRNNYQLLTEHPKGLTQINCPGPRVGVSDLRQLQAAVRRIGRRLKVLVCSGSLPPGAPVTIYRRLTELGHALQVPVVVDSSGPALRHSFSARPWLIKPNRQEAEEALGVRLGTRQRLVKAARRLVAMGPSLVVLSSGADGACLAADGGDALWAVPPTVPVGSAVGAGDSLVAGLVLGWQRTGSLREALRLGVACGAATALTPGTELCHHRDVCRLLSQVAIHPA